jgi:hypothetical protein
MASYDSITVERICKQMTIQKAGGTMEKYIKITHDTVLELRFKTGIYTTGMLM